MSASFLERFFPLTLLSSSASSLSGLQRAAQSHAETRSHGWPTAHARYTANGRRAALPNEGLGCLIQFVHAAQQMEPCCSDSALLGRALVRLGRISQRLRQPHWESPNCFRGCPYSRRVALPNGAQACEDRQEHRQSRCSEAQRPPSVRRTAGSAREIRERGQGQESRGRVVRYGARVSRSSLRHELREEQRRGLGSICADSDPNPRHLLQPADERVFESQSFSQFCSELTGESLQQLGVLREEGVNSNDFLPASFASASREDAHSLDHNCLDGTSYGDEEYLIRRGGGPLVAELKRIKQQLKQEAKQQRRGCPPPAQETEGRV